MIVRRPASRFRRSAPSPYRRLRPLLRRAVRLLAGSVWRPVGPLHRRPPRQHQYAASLAPVCGARRPRAVIITTEQRGLPGEPFDGARLWGASRAAISTTNAARARVFGRHRRLVCRPDGTLVTIRVEPWPGSERRLLVAGGRKAATRRRRLDRLHESGPSRDRLSRRTSHSPAAPGDH